MNGETKLELAAAGRYIVLIATVVLLALALNG